MIQAPRTRVVVRMIVSIARAMRLTAERRQRPLRVAAFTFLLAFLFQPATALARHAEVGAEFGEPQMLGESAIALPASASMKTLRGSISMPVRLARFHGPGFGALFFGIWLDGRGADRGFSSRLIGRYASAES